MNCSLITASLILAFIWGVFIYDKVVSRSNKTRGTDEEK